MAQAQVCGIVMELNPLHKGHQYLFEEIKKRFNNPLIIVITSGYFTMRGEVSLLSKKQKTEELLKLGVDLILELPTSYTLNSANLFAKYAVDGLKQAKIDYLCFGTEKLTNEDLLKLSEISNSELFNQTLKKYLKENSLKTAYLKTYDELKIEQRLKDLASMPNNTLALEYLRALENDHFMAFPRIGQFDNDFMLNNDSSFPSGSALRHAFNNKQRIAKYIPYQETKLKRIDLTVLNPLVQSMTLRQDELKQKYQTNEGEINYILKNLTPELSYEDAIAKLTNKKYSSSKIRREILKLILNLEPQKFALRVLGFSQRGINHLKTIYAKINSSLNDLDQNYYHNEYNAAFLYSMLCKENIIKDEFIFPIKEQSWKN